MRKMLLMAVVAAIFAVGICKSETAKGQAFSLLYDTELCDSTDLLFIKKQMEDMLLSMKRDTSVFEMEKTKSELIFKDSTSYYLMMAADATVPRVEAVTNLSTEFFTGKDYFVSTQMYQSIRSQKKTIENSVYNPRYILLEWFYKSDTCKRSRYDIALEILISEEISWT